MKDEFKKYLESETELNKRSLHVSEIFVPICIALIILGLGLIGFALYMAFSY